MRYKDLVEGTDIQAGTRKGQRDTMLPTFVMPDIDNSNSYLQYRHGIALAAALSVENGDIKMDSEIPWGQNQSVVCYAPAEEEILKLANKHMGIKTIPLTNTQSKESPIRNIVSPVRKFVDFTESMRNIIDSITKK